MQGLGFTSQQCQSLADNFRSIFDITPSNASYALESGLKVPQANKLGDGSPLWDVDPQVQSDPWEQTNNNVTPIASEMSVRPGDIVEALYSSKWICRLLRFLLGSQPITLKVKDIGSPYEFELEPTEFSMLSLFQSLRVFILSRLLIRAVQSEKIELIIGVDGTIFTGSSIGVQSTTTADEYATVVG